MIQDTDDMYQIITDKNPIAAAYILTNAHRRRVLVSMNARDLYHFSRLREDEHAQWEIRSIANQMLEQTKSIMPLTFMLSCGKHEYAETYENIFGTRPSFDIP